MGVEELRGLSPTSPGTSSSRLYKYCTDSVRLDEMKKEGLPEEDVDEGFGEPEEQERNEPIPCRFSRCSPEQMMASATNMLILRDLPSAPYPCEKLAKDAIEECGIKYAVEIKVGKLPRMLYIYNLTASDQGRLAKSLCRNFPGVKTLPTMVVPPGGQMEDVTDMLLCLLTDKEKISYEDIYAQSHKSFLVLTEDLPFDTSRLVEVHTRDFYGIRRKNESKKHDVDRLDFLLLISIRRLAPLVHKLISPQAHRLDREFLETLRSLIAEDFSKVNENDRVAPAVEGEAQQKPLEHLVTCVPGVEVIWHDNTKVIRKLELPEKNALEQTLRGTMGAQPQSDRNERNEQDVVRQLSDILKKDSNLYMSFPALAAALQTPNPSLKKIRDFIINRPKHFQVLGEGDKEVVTLSHRAQIKRVCNDLQKVLRPRNPKCISSADIATAFTTHWRANDEVERRFNVEDFGVCYLDDLLVTIPQHWGVHCSEFVSAEYGDVRRRHRGDGEEDIPDFVSDDARARVYAWIPRQHQTDSQKKALALLKQQTLNMFRGDPSAKMRIPYTTRTSKRDQTPEYSRIHRLASLRANTQCNQQGVSPREGNPALPCNFQLEEKTFVPLYHRFCGEQVTLAQYGVRDLYELFDSMQETFIAEGHGQERVIHLTADAKREILERRVVDILRMHKEPMSEHDILHKYKEEPTMRPYYNVEEIKRAIRSSNLLAVEGHIDGKLRYRARERFQYRKAVSERPEVADVLRIFLLSYGPLDIETIQRRYFDETERMLSESVITYLFDKGAIRRSNEYDRRYDLHDICRVVRNLIYQMNEQPEKIYTVLPGHYNGSGTILGNDVSVLSLLSFSGDYTYIHPSTMLEVMMDFSICFEHLKSHYFRLKRSFAKWPPNADELDVGGQAGRRSKRAQGFRSPVHGRRNSPRHYTR